MKATISTSKAVGRRPDDEFEWMPIRYRNVIAILKNHSMPVICVRKSEKRTAIIDGRARKSYGHGKPIGIEVI